MMTSRKTLFCLSFALLSFFFCFSTNAAQPRIIKRVDLIHHSHTDIGYTDHPIVTRERQNQYLDIAIDAVLATKDAPKSEKYYWTAESGICIADWWKQASEERRQQLIEAIQTGQLEITALAMNQAPLMNGQQWNLMSLNWLPQEVRDIAPIKVGMQIDVNGCPRAGALALLDSNVPYLWMSINGHNGGAPFSQPSAFWWKMPDGRRLLVWLNYSYPEGYYFFHDSEWRRGPVPESTDTRYQLPREGDFFKTDPESMKKYHRRFCQRLLALERAGYSYPSLALSFTNQWRIDNDPPFPQLAEFVAKWNRLGLKPEVRLTTASAALDSLVASSGNKIPEYEGEFTDWWGNGAASGPREVAVSRSAKRLLNAAISPVFGELSDSTIAKQKKILEELCLFDEHTWGSVDSIGQPHSLDVLGQFNEKSRYTFHAVALAKLLLSERARAKVYRDEAGYHVVNTAPETWSGWIYALDSAFREDVQALRDVNSGQITILERQPGFASFRRAGTREEISPESDQETITDRVPNQLIRFWVDSLPGQESFRFLPVEQPQVQAVAADFVPRVTVDEQGWPVKAVWDNDRWKNQVLFDQPQGEFVAVEFAEFGGRWLYPEILHSQSEERRQKELISTVAIPNEGDAGQTTIEQGPYTTKYTQSMQHPRLKWLTRTLEIWNNEPRARLTVRFYRLSSEKPEWFFLGSSVFAENGEEGNLPEMSCGDQPFTPFADQLPGTCRDFFSMDSWIRYRSDRADRFLISRDAPLVTFGAKPDPIAKRQTAPNEMNSVYAQVFDNTWLTNFVCDEHGIMEFQFDLVLKEKPTTGESLSASDLAETILSEPVFVIHPKTPESELYMRHLHQP